MTPRRVAPPVARSAGDPKVRYIGFRLTSARPVSRRALIEAIRRAGSDHPRAAAAEPWLTRFDGSLGIVRCHHPGADATRTLLAGLAVVDEGGDEVPVSIETLQTAGTIRSLAEGRLKALQDTGRRR